MEHLKREAFFKPAIELIQIVCQMLIMHSAGMVSCNRWCLSYLSTLKQNHWKIIYSLACQNNSSLPLWSHFSVCIWPVYTRFYPPFCKHLLLPDGAVWVLQWTTVCCCCVIQLNNSWVAVNGLHFHIVRAKLMEKSKKPQHGV